MPNSRDGRQEVVQEEEEEQEQEVEQQDEEQVVKRRITVSRRPGSNRMKDMEMSLQLLATRVVNIRVANEKRILRQAAFTEKVISTSFFELQLLEQHFAFDSNEKKVKAGKSSKEG